MYRRASGLAALTVLALLAGCAQQVAGSPHPADSAEGLLPTEDELTSAVGNRLSTFDFQPFVGGFEIMPDGFRTQDDAAPIRCVGVTDTMTRVTYEPADVLEAARQSYFTWNEQVDVSGADAAAVRLATDADATGIYAAFTDRWRGCDGQTVVKHLRGTTGADVTAAISGVRVNGDLMSATVTTTQGDKASAHYERAVGVRGDTVAEVSLAVAHVAGQPPDGQAVRAVQVMLDKVGPG